LIYLYPFALSLSKGAALRLARYFGTDAESWLNLQLSYDLKIAEAGLEARIEREVEEITV
jgi:plasmid maintenance system antidote protein VapI